MIRFGFVEKFLFCLFAVQINCQPVLCARPLIEKSNIPSAFCALYSHCTNQCSNRLLRSSFSLHKAVFKLPYVFVLFAAQTGIQAVLCDCPLIDKK